MRSLLNATGRKHRGTLRGRRGKRAPLCSLVFVDTRVRICRLSVPARVRMRSEAAAVVALGARASLCCREGASGVHRRPDNDEKCNLRVLAFLGASLSLASQSARALSQWNSSRHDARARTCIRMRLQNRFRSSLQRSRRPGARHIPPEEVGKRLRLSECQQSCLRHRAPRLLGLPSVAAEATWCSGVVLCVKCCCSDTLLIMSCSGVVLEALVLEHVIAAPSAGASVSAAR